MASCTELVLCARELLARRITTDGVQLLSSCTEYVADEDCEWRWCLIHPITITRT